MSLLMAFFAGLAVRSQALENLTLVVLADRERRQRFSTRFPLP